MAVRSIEPTETALLVRSGPGEEMSHLGAMVRGGGRRWARSARFSGEPRRGQQTSGISKKNRFGRPPPLPLRSLSPFDGAGRSANGLLATGR